MTDKLHVERLGDLNADQQYCLDMLCNVFGGLHRLPRKIDAFGKTGITFCIGGCLATYDFDHLTRLVEQAHMNRVRVELSPAGFYIRLTATRRSSTGPMHKRHPGVERFLSEPEAIRRWKLHNEAGS